jgi:ribosomal 50S subunit-recycling heat shock protein
MAKAIIMKTSGIVTVNGKNVKAGKFLNDGDVVKTGPESFTAWIYTDDKTQRKMRENQTWTFTDMTNEEMRAEASIIPVKEAEARGFVLQVPTGVAGVIG